MTPPILCLHLTEVAGWAMLSQGFTSSGWRDFADRTNPKPGLSLPSLGAWLGMLRYEQSRFAAIGVIGGDHILPMTPFLDGWARSTGAALHLISPATIKRVASGPYASRRDVLRWAQGKNPRKTIDRYEQAAALAGLEYLAGGDPGRKDPSP